jgi:hypothetical protein
VLITTQSAAITVLMFKALAVAVKVPRLRKLLNRVLRLRARLLLATQMLA